MLAFASRQEWEAWLAGQHDTSPGVRIKFAKTASGIRSVRYPEALEVALCYGWIDGQVSALDEDHYLQRFTPRTPRSRWSQVNRAKALELIQRGAMAPAGLREVERAQADGRWDAAYAPPSTAAVPPDLQRELDRSPAAAEFFSTLDSQNRYAILYRIQDAKKPETRARRIATFVAMLADQQKIYP